MPKQVPLSFFLTIREIYMAYYERKTIARSRTGDQIDDHGYEFRMIDSLLLLLHPNTTER